MAALPDPSAPLDRDAAAAAFDAILSGDADDAEIEAFLIALAERGETADEIAAAAGALRDRMIGVDAPANAIDLCGTGGDGAHTLNVSTAAAFVVAACGVPVAKHGNRAASSKSGAADVLAALGVSHELPFDRVEACLAELGIAFLHAARHHPAVGRVAPIRRRIGRRTIFNLLGPLANPAGVTRQLVGVPAPRWVAPEAEALRLLGSEAAVVVHGDGLDELALHGPSTLMWLRHARLMEAGFTPGDAVPSAPLEAIRGGSPDENAAAMTALFAGDRSTPTLRAYADIVCLNAAAALKLADVADGWADGVAQARAALDGGAAADLLARFVAFR